MAIPNKNLAFIWMYCPSSYEASPDEADERKEGTARSTNFQKGDIGLLPMVVLDRSTTQKFSHTKTREEGFLQDR